jgi:hypothetical protein
MAQLSGWVGITNSDGDVIDVRNVGSDPIGVKSNVVQVEGPPGGGYQWDVATQAWVLPTAVRYPPLEAWRVWTIADISSLDIPAGIEASDASATIKAVARNQWKAPPGGYFTRDNPLFSNADFLTAFSKTADDINTLWDAAATLDAP